MDRAEQLQFQRLPAEAQYETLWRLALSGLTVEQVAERTGWSPDRIRRAINPEPPKAQAPWCSRHRTRSHHDIHMVERRLRIDRHGEAT
ncbi:MAG TPA: hypothetical protein VF033_00260 [Steroidobacteraceae bacterium]